MRKLFLITLLSLAGCASHSGVVPVGSGTLSITKQAATGFGGLGNLKSEVHQEASEYCGKQKKDFEVLRYSETPGPYIMGNYPRVDLTFRCV